MILDGDIIPLTLERKTPEGFLCGHAVDMGGFEPRPWKQFGIELEVYFDQNEIERIEREDPEVIVPPSPPALAPPCGAWGVPKAPPAIPSPTAVSAPSRDLAEAQARIADLERQLEEARQKEDVLAVRVATLEAEQGKISKTAPGLKAAQASRVEEWKGYAVVMAKIAYDCGLEDRKQVTRSKYKQIAQKHGELSGQALKLLRGALPKEVTKKTGGPATQG